MYIISVRFTFNSWDVDWVVDEGDICDTIKMLDTADQVESYDISQTGKDPFVDVVNQFGLLSRDDHPKLR